MFKTIWSKDWSNNMFQTSFYITKEHSNRKWSMGCDRVTLKIKAKVYILTVKVIKKLQVRYKLIRVLTLRICSSWRLSYFHTSNLHHDKTKIKSDNQRSNNRVQSRRTTKMLEEDSNNTVIKNMFFICSSIKVTHQRAVQQMQVQIIAKKWI